MNEPALLLPENLRFDFARPRGPIISGDFTRHFAAINPITSLVCVGDYVSKYCMQVENASLLMLIIDGKTRRHTDMTIISPEGFRRIHLSNPPGRITMGSLKTICNALSQEQGRILVTINGEEDMLALPSIACSPLGGFVIYGIPGRGAAIIKVTRLVKWEAGNRLLLLRPSFPG